MNLLMGNRPQQACDCRKLFGGNEDSDKLAPLLEELHPQCLCEKFSVGQNSPGPVKDAELLHRIIVSPRDYDPVQGKISARPFEKVFTNGLSVWRAIGHDNDVRILMMDGLSRNTNDPRREVFAVCELRAGDVRNMMSESAQKVFCIYDQTVARAREPSLPPVRTHAGIFLRAFPPPERPTEGKYRRIMPDSFMTSSSLERLPPPTIAEAFVLT